MIKEDIIEGISWMLERMADIHPDLYHEFKAEFNQADVEALVGHMADFGTKAGHPIDEMYLDKLYRVTDECDCTESCDYIESSFRFILAMLREYRTKYYEPANDMQLVADELYTEMIKAGWKALPDIMAHSFPYIIPEKLLSYYNNEYDDFEQKLYELIAARLGGR